MIEESLFGPSRVTFQNGGSIASGDFINTFARAGEYVSVTNTGTFTNAGEFDDDGGLLTIGMYGTFNNTGTYLTQNPGALSFLNAAMDGGVIANSGLIESRNGAGSLLFGGESWSPQGVATSPFLGSITNTGIIEASGAGSVVWLLAPVNGTGSVDLVDGGRIAIGAPVASGETINITSGILEFGDPGSISNPAMQFLGTIAGFGLGDAMIFDGVLGKSATWTPSGTGGTLEVFNAAHVVLADLHLAGTYTTANFIVESSVSGGFAHTTILADPRVGIRFPPSPP